MGKGAHLMTVSVIPLLACVHSSFGLARTRFSFGIEYSTSLGSQLTSRAFLITKTYTTDNSAGR